MDLGLLFLRAAVGGIIAAHGAQKLFGSFEGPGIEGFAGVSEKMGLKPGRPYATLAGTAEFGGGGLLLLGFLTPFGAAAVAGMMISAIVLVHLPNGFFNTAGGMEFPLLMGTAALVLAFTGPGSASLDALLGLGLKGIAWGFVSVALAAIGSTLLLASRTEEAPAAEDDVTEDDVTEERSAA